MAGHFAAVAGARLGAVDAVLVRHLTFALLAQSLVPERAVSRRVSRGFSELRHGRAPWRRSGPPPKGRAVARYKSVAVT